MARLNTRQAPGPKGKVRPLHDLGPTLRKARKDRGVKQVTIIQRPKGEGEWIVDFLDGTTDRHHFASWSVLVEMQRTNRSTRGSPALAILKGGSRIRGDVGVRFSERVQRSSGSVRTQSTPKTKRPDRFLETVSRQRDFDRA